MPKLYAVEQKLESGVWTRQGVGGKRMLTTPGANGQVFRPRLVNGQIDGPSEALLQNRLPEAMDVIDRGDAASVLATYLGRPTRVAELAVIACDQQRMRQDPPDPWWVAAKAAVALGAYPRVDGDRRGRGVAFLLTDPRPSGLEVTTTEADAILAWAAALPGWAVTERPQTTDQVVRRGEVKTRRWAGWSGAQLRREDPA